MTIKEIKNEIYDMVGSKEISIAAVCEVVDALSELVFQEGKICDLLIINGKKITKKKEKNKRKC